MGARIGPLRLWIIRTSGLRNCLDAGADRRLNATMKTTKRTAKTPAEARLAKEIREYEKRSQMCLRSAAKEYAKAAKLAARCATSRFDLDFDKRENYAPRIACEHAETALDAARHWEGQARILRRMLNG